MEGLVKQAQKLCNERNNYKTRNRGITGKERETDISIVFIEHLLHSGAVQENRPKSGIKSPIMSQCLGDKALQERRDLPQTHNQSSPEESYKTLKL